MDLRVALGSSDLESFYDSYVLLGSSEDPAPPVPGPYMVPALDDLDTYRRFINMLAACGVISFHKEEFAVEQCGLF